MKITCAEATKNGLHRPILEQAINHMQNLPLTAIDCGCGAGNESNYLLNNGFSVTAFDCLEKSKQLCSERFQNHPRFSFYQTTFEYFCFPKASLVVALFSLFFCQPSQLTRVLSNIKDALPKDGIFLLQLLGTHDAWVKHTPQRFKGFSKQTLETLFKQDYEILFYEEEQAPKPLANGDIKNWHLHTLILKKRYAQ